MDVTEAAARDDGADAPAAHRRRIPRRPALGRARARIVALHPIVSTILVLIAAGLVTG